MNSNEKYANWDLILDLVTHLNVRSRRPTYRQIILRNGYMQTMKIPIYFTALYGDNLPRTAVLRTRTGTGWYVTIQRDVDGDWYFGRGWERFAADAKLELYDWLVFSFGYKYTVELWVYDSNGRAKQPFGNSLSGKKTPKEKKYQTDFPMVEVIELLENGDIEPSASNTKSDGVPQYYDQSETITEHIDVLAVENNIGHISDLKFDKLLSSSYKKKMSVGIDFVKAANLVRKNKVVMEYKNGHRSTVYLKKRKNHARSRFELKEGWEEFCEINGISIGKTYSFQFIPNKNLIEITEVATE